MNPPSLYYYPIPVPTRVVHEWLRELMQTGIQENIKIVADLGQTF